MSKKIDYYKDRNKYYNGGLNNIDLNFDTIELSDEEIKNNNELLNSLYDLIVNVPKKNEIYTLRYVGTNKDSLMFEGGFKDYVRVANKPAELKYFKTLTIGDEIDLLITNVNERNFWIEGSIASLYETKAHEALKSLKEDDSVVAWVKELTPAGFNVDLHCDSIILPGFMPNTLAGINKVADPDALVGMKLEVMIENYSEEEKSYVVSRRKYLQSLIPNEIKKLKINSVYSGKVTGRQEFGIFIEFAAEKNGVVCLSGLCHRTNINPEWQDKIMDIQPGYEIEFYVKDIVKGNKIILSQMYTESLWDTIEPDQILNGVVKEHKQFGALISLSDGVIGLIHTSELEKHNKDINTGQNIKVRVITSDRPNRKIHLAIA